MWGPTTHLGRCDFEHFRMPGESPCKRGTLRRSWVGPGPRAGGDGADGCRRAMIWAIGQPSAALDIIADVVLAVARRCFDPPAHYIRSRKSTLYFKKRLLNRPPDASASFSIVPFPPPKSNKMCEWGRQARSGVRYVETSMLRHEAIGHRQSSSAGDLTFVSPPSPYLFCPLDSLTLSFMFSTAHGRSRFHMCGACQCIISVRQVNDIMFSYWRLISRIEVHYRGQEDDWQTSNRSID